MATIQIASPFGPAELLRFPSNVVCRPAILISIRWHVCLIFTRPLLPEGSSLQVEILSVYLIVRHHFKISVLWPSNHPRTMSDPTYYIPLDLVSGGVRWCQCISIGRFELIDVYGQI